VDDGSTDGTARVAEGYAGRDPRIIVQREPHGGKGAAVKAGLLAATGSYRFICDADLSMPIRELARFLPPLLAGADVAIGTREGAGARRVAEPTRRHLVGRTFNYLVQRLLLPGLHDTQCGFKMFTAVAVERIFRDMTVDGWSFDIEALYLARRCGLRIVEVPIEWHYRAESRLNVLRDGPAMLLDLLRIRFRG
jgi:glycosyltransferase involved in cell wall biosynthesis